MKKRNQNTNHNQFLIQGSILATAGIIVRMIGLLKRIPLTNIIGDEGNGYYAAAYEIYSIMLLISSYSLPLAVSKLVSARVGKGQFHNAQKIFRVALLFSMISGGMAGLFVYFGSDFLAGTIMLEPMSSFALRILAPALLIVAIMGVFRGYFQGLGTMMPTAVSQIIEQIFVVIASLTGAVLLFKYGSKVGNLLQNDSYAAAYGAAGGTIGPVVGACIGLLFLWFVYSLYQKRLHKQVTKDRSSKEETYGQILRILILTVLPVILSTAIYNISNILDQRIYNQIMIEKGLESVKSINWGVFTGKYKALTNIPIALASAMCASAVPAIVAFISQENENKAREKVAEVNRFTMAISIPCAIGLAVLARPVVELLFNGEIDMAVTMLHIGSISIIFYSLSTLSNGILQAINKMRIPVMNAFIALVIHIIALVVMLQYFNLGINAVVYANIIFSLLMCILNSLSIRKHLHYKQEFKKTFMIPAICAGIMGFIIFLFKTMLQSLLGTATWALLITVVSSFLIGVMIYFILMVTLKGITAKELQRFPGGNQLIKIAKTLRIMS